MTELALGTPFGLLCTSFVLAGLVIAGSAERSWLLPALAGAGIWALVAFVIALPLGAIGVAAGVLETGEIQSQLEGEPKGDRGSA
jgi:hypothetical protein